MVKAVFPRRRHSTFINGNGIAQRATRNSSALTMLRRRAVQTEENN
jgi:hypothetical protein